MSLFQQVLIKIKYLLKAFSTYSQVVGRLLVMVVFQGPPVQREDSGSSGMLSVGPVCLGA